MLGAVAALVLGLVLVEEGLRKDQVERLRLAALRLSDHPELASRQRRIAYLEAAARLTPELAPAQLEAARAHLNLVEERRVERTDSGPADAAEEALLREHLVAGLGRYLNARDLCPLMSQAQIGIAAHREGLDRGDPREAYLDRATFLEPVNPDLWYACGLQQIADRQLRRAAHSWHRALELSEGHLDDILAKSCQEFPPAEILEQILPPTPGLLFTAAFQLYPEPDARPQRQPFLQKALRLLEQRAGGRTPEDLHLEAKIHEALGEGADAVAAYRLALARAPQQVQWR